MLVLEIAQCLVFTFEADYKRARRMLPVGSVGVGYAGLVKEHLSLLYGDLLFTRDGYKIALFGIHKLPEVVRLGVALEILVKFKVMNDYDFAYDEKIFKLVLIIFLFHSLMVSFFLFFVNRFGENNSKEK